jgi:hypothetical protein
VLKATEVDLRSHDEINSGSMQVSEEGQLRKDVVFPLNARADVILL